MNRRQRRAFEAGQKAAATGVFPPAYIALVKRLAGLIPVWIAAEPTPPDLRWHDTGNVCVTGNLSGVCLQYLANSPDAFRLLLWLDEQTGHEATLLMAKIALGFAGQVPLRSNIN